MSEASKGRTMSLKTREKLSISKQNISKETRKKLSDALKDKPHLSQRGKTIQWHVLLLLITNILIPLKMLQKHSI